MQGQWGSMSRGARRPAHLVGMLHLQEGLSSPDVMTCRGREPPSKTDGCKQTSKVNRKPWKQVYREPAPHTDEGEDSNAEYTAAKEVVVSWSRKGTRPFSLFSAACGTSRGQMQISRDR